MVHLARLVHGLVSILFLSCLAYVYYCAVTGTHSCWLMWGAKNVIRIQTVDARAVWASNEAVKRPADHYRDDVLIDKQIACSIGRSSPSAQSR